MANFKQYLFNEYSMYTNAGTYTWTKPSDLDETKPILVHVWGAGGAGVDSYASNYIPHGAGGGGLAVKLIDPSGLGSTETITIGAGSVLRTGIGGTSSFGSHCSATGGNSGNNSTANQGSAATNGVGGLGINGDVNRRGGHGGTGYFTNTSDAGGGGGGGAPAPYGYRDGFKGGNSALFGCGGGGGIAAQGNDGTYTGGAGGGSMAGSRRSQSPSSCYVPEDGGNGLLGTGSTGSSGNISYYSSGGWFSNQSENGKGPFQIGPNEILCGGGGGCGVCTYTFGTGVSGSTDAGSGGPGGGGGGVGSQTDSNQYCSAGDGGFLGGGGGAGGYCFSGGNGGNAGGGGGVGYYRYGGDYGVVNHGNGGFGGDGVAIIQYARIYAEGDV